jgi:antitoxin component YwqK of YwqJK toxin-antitoxin module
LHKTLSLIIPQDGGIPCPPGKLRQKKYIQYHKDGSIWAVGQTINGVATGYWEWFRKDGTKLRSGTFENGEQTGVWTTYDKKGNVYKVTTIKPKGK